MSRFSRGELLQLTTIQSRHYLAGCSAATVHRRVSLFEIRPDMVPKSAIESDNSPRTLLVDLLQSERQASAFCREHSLGPAVHKVHRSEKQHRYLRKTTTTYLQWKKIKVTCVLHNTPVHTSTEENGFEENHQRMEMSETAQSGPLSWTSTRGRNRSSGWLSRDLS